MGGESWLRFVWMDRRRLVDLGDRPSREQELADELGDAQRRHMEGVQARRDAQQEIGDHRGKDLQTDGIVVVAEEIADAQMLLDRGEQEFDLPAAVDEHVYVDLVLVQNV